MPEHGGKRTPRNPAPVSGPGQLSRRTDGGPQQTTVPMTGMGYGENADFNEMQSAAPMAAAPSVSTTRARSTSPTGQRAAATPLFAPTQRPEEPITAGAPFGPGPGPEAMTALRNRQTLTSLLQRVSQQDDSGDAEFLAALAQRLGW